MTSPKYLNNKKATLLKYMCVLHRVGGLMTKKNSKVTPHPDAEEISFKDFSENTEKRLTLNLVKVKPGSNSNIARKSQIYDKIKTDTFENNSNTPIPLKRSFHSNVNSDTFNDMLFEKFLVIGVNKKDLLGMEESRDTNTDLETQNLRPKILYNYPKGNNEEVIQDFAFPFGVPTEKITGPGSFARINAYI